MIESKVLKVFIDGVEYPVVNYVVVVAEFDDHENDLAQHSPHSLEIHTKFTHEGIFQESISDAYNSNLKLTEEIVEKSCISWDLILLVG
jgi:hypothetical protein